MKNTEQFVENVRGRLADEVHFPEELCSVWEMLQLLWNVIDESRLSGVNQCNASCLDLSKKKKSVFFRSGAYVALV